MSRRALPSQLLFAALIARSHDRSITRPAGCVMLALAIASGLAACAPNSASLLSTSSITPGTDAAAKKSAARPAKIALLLPLAGFGDAARIGKGMKQAAEMALFEFDDPAIQLIVKDDGGSPENARQAAEQAIGEGAEIILGPLMGRSALGAGAVTGPAGVPLVTFSNDRQVAGRGVYVMGFTPENEVERVVSFAASRGKKRFAALIPANAYGKACGDAFRAAVAASGGVVSRIDTVSPIEAEAQSTIAQFNAAVAEQAHGGAPLDAVFIAGDEHTLPGIAASLSIETSTGTPQLLGTSAWNFPAATELRTLNAGWYAGPDPAARQVFEAKFTKTFGAPPPRLATLAYDAMSVAVTLAQRHEQPRFTSAALTRAEPFKGVDGELQFTGVGQTKRALAVIEMTPAGARVIEPAPRATSDQTRFDWAIN